MPRPKLHSDDTILAAAQQVLLTRGPSSFTLSDVASAVGISRAALIQRFSDKATLHLKVMERSTQEVRDYFAAAPNDVGLTPLWTMLKDLIDGMGAGDGFAGYLLLEWSDVVDDRLNALAQERNHLVRAAILERLPAGPHDPETAAGLIQSVIQGATMQWLIDKPGALNRFVIDRTRHLLQILYPDHAFD
ncbi:TetR/AcrR family transcriptional regulator [Pelagibacterium sp. H642]|uniref:TetR/AcrR family transcriptional regulator n=1 Tax=Pelagibacterium sp. H642 TaxID=1881069 RepID=UPI002815BD9F|nr:TetR/AcrR family transcriptional regulator [Pelagibacterium sp. H642]WMT91329.1 TetR/AcrR family transcriptional regulator [Pelagibacterium sp. H642]